MVPLSTDEALQAVFEKIRALDPDGRRSASVLRDTLDQLYDGQRTGRYRLDQLYKTEKTNCGTLVEINLQREFDFGNGDKMDYQICGFDVDCKYSQEPMGCMIPPEALGHLCLLLWADDSVSKWSMGLVRITADRLGAPNRDLKAKLNSHGREAIRWLFQNAPLPSNILLHLERTTVDRIMALESGQKRINELFRVALGKIVGRAVVATVAQQDDYMKRVRGNGGARTALRGEGIIILGQFKSHSRIAEALRVPVPGKGESVSVRIVPARKTGLGVAKIGGALWRVALPEDPHVQAPDLPSV